MFCGSQLKPQGSPLILQLLLTNQFYVWLLNRNILVWFLIVSSLGALMFLVYVRRCHTIFIYWTRIDMYWTITHIYIMKLLLDSLVQSHIYYALPVWGPSLSLQLSSHLKRLQNRAVRLAFSLKRYDRVSDYYKQLNWLPLDQFIKFRYMCSMYK